LSINTKPLDYWHEETGQLVKEKSIRNGLVQETQRTGQSLKGYMEKLEKW
jgi:hypothetical protein